MYIRAEMDNILHKSPRVNAARFVQRPFSDVSSLEFIDIAHGVYRHAALGANIDTLTHGLRRAPPNFLLIMQQILVSGLSPGNVLHCKARAK